MNTIGASLFTLFVFFVVRVSLLLERIESSTRMPGCASETSTDNGTKLTFASVSLQTGAGGQPVSPSPSPSDLSYPQECKGSYDAWFECLKTNYVTCAPSLFALSDVDTSNKDCATLDSDCRTFSEICTPCLPLAKALFQCAGSAVGCDDTCVDVAPVAPSPRSPVSPATANCVREELVLDDCYKVNEASCPFERQKFSTLKSCDDLALICSSGSCSQCASQIAAAGECMSDLYDCQKNDCSSAWKFSNTSTVIAGFLSFLSVVLLNQEYII